MVKTLTAIAAAGVIAAATLSAPNKAEANPAWVVPALIAGGAVLTVGAIASANARPYAYEPAGQVYVQPRAVQSCHIVRERTAGGGYRRIQVCD